MDNILKHLSELRSLGMVKITGTKEKTIYSINSNAFEQVSTKFMALFNHVEPANPKLEQSPEEVMSISADAGYKGDTVRYLNFGVFIKKHRTELHLSQDDLARKLGMDRAELSRIECGKKVFSTGKLWALSKALYLDYSNLSKEYYSYQIADLVEKSGLSDVMLESMMNRQLYSTTR